MKSATLLLVGTIALAGSVVGAAEHASDAGSPALKALAHCKAETDPTKRLACYDAAAGDLLAAEARADVVVVDRAEVEKTRTSLFGLAVPEIPIFKRHGTPMPALEQVDGVLASTSTNSSGQYLFRLEDGARWQQIDTYAISRTPRAGDKVVIKRAALGSFKLSIAGGASVRVHRIN